VAVVENDQDTCDIVPYIFNGVPEALRYVTNIALAKSLLAPFGEDPALHQQIS
jgi:hypothetical protein